MPTSWDRHTDETEEWYDRFRIYLYMGPHRTLAAAHRFATRFAKQAGATSSHGHLSSWRRAAQRKQWSERAAAYDAELCRKALANDERLTIIAELLHQLYSVLRHADIATLSKEEAGWRPLRDLLAHLYPDEASARRMAAQAQLDSARIRFSPRAVDTWHAILTEAEQTDQIECLIEIVLREYGKNSALRKAIEHYRTTQTK